MKNLFLAVLMAFLVSSCSTSKKIAETDKSITKKTTERKTITRPGDTLRIYIPNIRHKDTTIYTVNHVNKTIASVTYDDEGNQLFECLSAKIDEKLERILEEKKNDISIEKDVQNEFNPQYLFYSIAALALIVVIGIGFLGFIMMKIQKDAPKMTAEIIKSIIK